MQPKDALVRGTAELERDVFERFDEGAVDEDVDVREEAVRDVCPPARRH
jgi:hypothetical protein